jgi:PqqD family protein of HPr-rel-A system
MSGPRYIADPADCLRKIELDALTACFHRPSGTTHILAPPAPQILAALEGQAGDRDEILARMADSYDLEAEDAAASVAARLAELEAAGLVRRCASPSLNTGRG